MMADDRCATRWPLLLVHGIGLRDNWRVRYWGRIPEALIEHGARVHYGMQDAWGSIEDNAAMLRETLLSLVEQEGCEKVNIIAHSKGGLDARVLASMGDCAPHIASLTTIASPHGGSCSMDAIMRIPAPLLRLTDFFLNGFFRRLGDSSPDFRTVCSQLTTGAMRDFNERYPAADGLFCQSYAVAMKRLRDDPTMAFSHLVVRCFEGANDGLVAVASTPFGEFKGLIEGPGTSGISHCNVVDLSKGLLKHPPSPVVPAAPAVPTTSAATPATPAPTTPVAPVAEEATDDDHGKPYDIVDWYTALVADLKARGL